MTGRESVSSVETFPYVWISSICCWLNLWMGGVWRYKRPRAYGFHQSLAGDAQLHRNLEACLAIFFPVPKIYLVLYSCSVEYLLPSQSLLANAKLPGGRISAVLHSISVLATSWCSNHNVIRKTYLQMDGRGSLNDSIFGEGYDPDSCYLSSHPWMLGRDLNLDPFAVFPQNSNRNVLRKCSYGPGNAWNIRLNPHFS